MVDHLALAIVGSGPAGLEAAATAAESGVKVLLVDAYDRPGGQYFKQLPAAFGANDRTGHQREAEELIHRLASPNIRYLPGTLTWGVFPLDDGPGWELALYGTPESPADSPAAPKHVQRITAECLIIAPGAYDRPIPFPGWTLPGVLTAGAVQTLIKSQRVLPGRRFLLSGTGPLQLAVAAALLRAGAEVCAVLEGARVDWRFLRHAPAAWGQWQRLAEGLDYARVLASARVPVRTGWAVVAAHGDEEVSAATLARLDARWAPIPGTEQTLEVDTIVLGYGFVPSTELSRLIGCEHTYRPELGGHVPLRDNEMRTSIPGVYVVGDGGGVAGAGSARIEGRIAAISAARRLGCLDADAAARLLRAQQAGLARERRFAAMLGAAFTPGPGLYTLAADSTTICRCEETTLAQIKAAVADGAQSATEVKGLTRAGMGNCQGRICGTLVPRLIADELTRLGRPGRDVPDLLSVRPPIHPLPLAALAEAETPELAEDRSGA